MEEKIVYDDAVTRLIELCRSNFTGDIKAIYEGDPIDIPKASIPAIIVEKISKSISLTNAPTGHDRYTETIRVRVILNKADDLGASDSFDLTERKLRNFIEGRNPQTGKYLEGTLMHVLRTHLTLSNTQFNADMEINYDVNPRPNDVVTSEGQVVITAEGITAVDSRD